MSLKTRRRKMTRRRNRDFGIGILAYDASAPIFGVGPASVYSDLEVVRRDDPSKSRVVHRHFWFRNPDGTITEKEQIGDGPWVERKRPTPE